MAEVVGYDRQCRSCSKWTAFAGKLTKAQTCEFCRAPYGPLVLGMDVPREKAKAAGAVPKGQSRAPVASDFKPGDYGYVSPKRDSWIAEGTAISNAADAAKDDDVRD